ncbi:hypothetical protein BJV78DRAFT_1240753 [Lactifluus subvellereus]|nr:hypothetical protein BJV78DRAFT_1240753 [Lactifluus subvellereus]
MWVTVGDLRPCVLVGRVSLDKLTVDDSTSKSNQALSGCPTKEKLCRTNRDRTNASLSELTRSRT